MTNKNTLKQEQLEKVSGGRVVLSEFFFTLKYENANGETKTGTISASGTNRTSAKTLALEKANDYCSENGYTFISLE